MEPLGFIAGALAGACAWELTSSICGRRSKLAPRLAALERCVAQHDTELEEISDMLNHELSESDSRQSGLADEIETIKIAQGKTLQAFEERLQKMQAFIVQAAQQASERRVAEASAPGITGLDGAQGAEFNELVRQQRQAQQEFAARRRAQAVANFQQPAGGGL